MPNIPLMEMLDGVSHWAEVVFNADGQVAPTWFAQKESGLSFVFAPEGFEDKNMIADTVRKIFAEQHVVRYVSVMECWMLGQQQFGSSPLPDITKMKSIAGDPHRIEGVVFAAEDAETGLITGTRLIQRPAIGPAQLGKLEVSKPTEVHGRFTGILPHRGVAM